MHIQARIRCSNTHCHPLSMVYTKPGPQEKQTPIVYPGSDFRTVSRPGAIWTCQNPVSASQPRWTKSSPFNSQHKVKSVKTSLTWNPELLVFPKHILSTNYVHSYLWNPSLLPLHCHFTLFGASQSFGIYWTGPQTLPQTTNIWWQTVGIQKNLEHFHSPTKGTVTSSVPSIRSSIAFLTPLSKARASAGLWKVSPNFLLSTFQWWNVGLALV